MRIPPCITAPGAASAPKAARGTSAEGAASFAALIHPPGPGDSSGPSGTAVLHQAIHSARSGAAPAQPDASTLLSRESLASGMWNLLALNLQYQLATSRNSFTSNLLRARHEIAKNMIQNVR